MPPREHPRAGSRSRGMGASARSLLRLGPLGLLLAGSPAAPARANPRVTAIEARGSARVGGGTVEQMASWFRDGCLVRQTWAPLPDRGPTRTDEVGCVAAEGLKKVFDDADRRAARPGLLRAHSAASPRATADGEELPDIALVLEDGTRWRARDVESAADLQQLLDTLADVGHSTGRDVSLSVDGAAGAPASRAAQVLLVGLGADGRWLCSRVLSEKTLPAKSKRPLPRRPRPFAAERVSRLVDRLLEGITPENLSLRKEASIANSRWGSITVDVTFDEKSNGKLDASSALRVAERFSAEASRLSPLCMLP